MREYLNAKDALQSVSLRTMLNFNRTYEQEMLFKMVIGVDKNGKKIRSPFADEIFDNSGNQVPPKSVQDSIDSFLDMLEKEMRKELTKNDPVNSFSPRFTAARNAVPDMDRFKVEFKMRYHLDPEKPIDQAPMTQAEIDSLKIEAKKINSDLSFLGS